MRVVIFGATGNCGTSLIPALVSDPAVTSIVGVARRTPDISFDKTEWIAADISKDPLEAIVTGADAVVHLAWLIQPSRDLATLRATNVDGSRRVFDAVAAAGVRNLIYASSVGAYSAGPKDERVDESWPTEGIQTSFYSRHKAEVERMLDGFESEHPDIRVVRLRKALVFKREAASGVRRLFLGPMVPKVAFGRRSIPVIPDPDGRLRFQCVHSYDVGEAYRLAIRSDISGPFNITADPVLDSERLAMLLGARVLHTPPAMLRTAAKISWKLHLQPSPEGWVDMGLNAPLMDGSRAERELGWTPRYSSDEALLDLMDGLRNGEGIATPPLARGTSGPMRLREFVTGIGSRGGVN